MKAKGDQITMLQYVCILVNSTIGISVLSLPRWGASSAGTAGILATFIGLILFFILLLAIIFITSAYPQRNFFEITSLHLGKTLGRLISISFSIQYIILTSVIIREFTEVMATTLLRKTPLLVTIFVLVLTVALSTKKSLIDYGYINYYYFPFIIIPGLLLISFSLPNIDYTYILPVLGNEITLSSILKTSTDIIILPFFQIGLFTLFLVIPNMNNPKKALKGGMIGWMIITIMIMLMTTVTYAVFGTEQIKDEVWPVLALTRTIRLAIPPLQRLDVFFILFWVVTGFTTIFSGYLIATSFFAQSFYIKHTKLAYLFLPAFFFMALAFDNHVQLYEFMQQIGRITLLITTSLFLILVIMTLFKKRRAANEIP
ncbi:GerAB/ArcD/ProY family transporter [Amphibacillus cookii]|uniref:GerAB/ArcD/ProY family transporter n=1 Tax=Amphibacillus cookii TaxID=767787 RepID=UPI00195D1142|nr:endospore germination permease [Amphibacillus cookii]MBM7539807.1 spore germination protein [Amphibacillus cookii]